MSIDIDGCERYAFFETSKEYIHPGPTTYTITDISFEKNHIKPRIDKNGKKEVLRIIVRFMCLGMEDAYYVTFPCAEINGDVIAEALSYTSREYKRFLEEDDDDNE